MQNVSGANSAISFDNIASAGTVHLRFADAGGPSIADAETFDFRSTSRGFQVRRQLAPDCLLRSSNPAFQALQPAVHAHRNLVTSTSNSILSESFNSFIPASSIDEPRMQLC
jgi:hypothetical protein